MAYIKLLRKVLDRNGLDDTVKGSELQEAVAVINAYTTEMMNHYTPQNTRKLLPYGGNKECGKLEREVK